MGSSNSECLGLSHELVSLVLSLSLSLPFIAYLNLFRAVFFFLVNIISFFFYFFYKKYRSYRRGGFYLAPQICAGTANTLRPQIHRTRPRSRPRSVPQLQQNSPRSSFLSSFYLLFYLFFFLLFLLLFSICISLSLSFLCLLFFFHIAVEGTDKS